jgi:hypothetical protein
MTTEKLVNKALFGKTELASQKIELGVLQDLQENINKGVALGDLTKQQLTTVDNQAKLRKDLEVKLDNATAELTKQMQILDTKASDTKAFYNKAEQLYSAFINKASDLGIDYPKNIDTNFKILEKQVEFINNSIPKIKSK